LCLWDAEGRRPLRPVPNPAFHAASAAAGKPGDTTPLAIFTPHGLALVAVAPGRVRLWMVPAE